MKKTLSLLLALLMLAPTVLASCADNDSGDETKGNTNTPGNETESTATGEESSDNPYYEGYVDPFTNVSYDGRTFTVHNSINAATSTMQSSAYLIAGPEETTGDKVSDTAYERNATVQELLDINLVFDGYDWGYGDVAANIRTLMTTADTTYDLIINDIYGLAPIVTEQLFTDANDGANFDFSNPWWYDEFMKDISLNESLRFMLAGDFFIDMLRTAHALFMNKNVYIDLNLGEGDPNAVYQTVLNGEWTLDEFTSLISKCYVDNGDGVKDQNDTFGFVAMPSWGPVCPFIIAGDPGFIERDEEGYPVITVNNERSALLVEKLLTAYNHEANLVGVIEEQPTFDLFTEGRALFIGYQRLGTLENQQLVNSEEADLAVLPYPKLDELQENYVTSAHDTSELGFIPITVGDGERLDFISTVIEVLCRETYAQLLPVYYEESLKIRYTRDEASAQMIDIIHDNFGNGFALAYSNPLNGIFLKGSFGDVVTENVNTFASKVKGSIKGANKLLERMIDACEEKLMD